MPKQFEATYYHRNDVRNIYGYRWDKVKPSDVPDDVPIAVIAMHEAVDKSDPNAHDEHWRSWHEAIDKGYYVRLIHQPDPLKFVVCKNKDDAESKYGSVDREGKKKAAKDRRITIVNLSQFLNPDFWYWSDIELNAVRNKDVSQILGVVVERLEHAGFSVEKAYGILHDKDMVELWDVVNESYKWEPKEDHVHILAKLGGHGASLEKIAEIVGLEPEFLLYPMRGRYAWDNPLAYLIHAKDEDKHPYRPQEVVTYRGVSYLDEYAKKAKEWEIGRAIKAKDKTRHDLPWLLDQIRSGRVRNREQIRLNSEMERIYSRNVRQCDEALRYLSGVRVLDSATAIRNKEYTMTVVFIYGESGLGKSSFQVAFTDYLRDVYGWDVSWGAGTHATEQWDGSEVYGLDDAESEGMSATTWKHFLDPHHANPIDQRYMAKDAGKPRVVVISSEYSPEAFFAEVAMKANMNIDQFLRRAGVVLKVMSFDEMDCYNCQLYLAKRVPRYTLVTTRLAAEKVEIGNTTKRGQRRQVYEFSDVKYSMRPPDEYHIDYDEDAPPLFTPWGAAEETLRIIDVNNHGIIAQRADAQEVFAGVRDYIADAFKRAFDVPDDYQDMPLALPFDSVGNQLPSANGRVLTEYEKGKVTDGSGNELVELIPEVSERPSDSPWAEFGPRDDIL